MWSGFSEAFTTNTFMIWNLSLSTTRFNSCYEQFWLDLGRLLARLPARLFAQPCLYTCARPSVLVSHIPADARALYCGSPLAACARHARPSIHPCKVRPWSHIATISVIYRYLSPVEMGQSLMTILREWFTIVLVKGINFQWMDSLRIYFKIRWWICLAIAGWADRGSIPVKLKGLLWQRLMMYHLVRRIDACNRVPIDP